MRCECRMAPWPWRWCTSIDEDTVDFVPNYDGRSEEPSILPARASPTCSSTVRRASPSAWLPISATQSDGGRRRGAMVTRPRRCTQELQGSPGADQGSELPMGALIVGTHIGRPIAPVAGRS
ncbi:MAG: hypothetical protein R2709_10770 [Marmoricola sp.]